MTFKDLPNPVSTRQLSRRSLLAASLAGSVAIGKSGSVGQAAQSTEHLRRKPPFGFCFNTATIMGHRLSLLEQVEIAAKAGYDGIEPWIRTIEQFVESGGRLSEARKRMEDAGLVMVSAIGFPAWAAEDDDKRNKAVEQLKREMDLVAQLGGRLIAAPPAGINRGPKVDLRRVADRYRAVLELGEKMGVTPQLEIWGTSANLSRVSEAAFVAIESGHPGACLLLDVYHIYRGGSSFDSLQLLNGATMHVFHMNDYPTDIPREQLNDSHRVYPGDGGAPIKRILQTLYKSGFRGMLSLELFNRRYWEQDPLLVAKTGLQKMRALAEAALAAS